MVTSDSTTFLDLYHHYKNGMLPLSGGLLEQPAVFYEAMTILDKAIKSGN